MNQLDAINLWYNNLQPREKLMVVAASIALAITIFYVAIWEPVIGGLEEQQLLYKNQQSTLLWMKQASAEVKSLQRSGATTNRKSTNQPISLILEQSASTAGLNNSLTKIETSGKAGAKVKLESVSFDQMLIWINTLKRNYGVTITSANVERTEKTGAVDARLAFTK